jgi:capsule polysaccharide export protein KpsE/RkpR
MNVFLTGVWVGGGASLVFAFIIILFLLCGVGSHILKAEKKGRSDGERFMLDLLTSDQEQLTLERDNAQRDLALALAEITSLRSKANRQAKEDPFDF